MFAFAGRYPFNHRTWPYVAGAVVLALVIALLVDVGMSGYAKSWPQPWAGFFATITDLGESGWILFLAIKLIILTAALAFIVHDRLPRQALLEQSQLWAFVFLGVGIPSLVANILKRAIGRGRPEQFDQYGYLSFHSFAHDWRWEGFPSGHSTTIWALAMVVGFLWPRWFIPAAVVAVLVMVSRVAVGMHYPSDTIGGAVCGILVAYLVRNAFAARGWLFEMQPGGTVARRHFPALREAFGYPRAAR